MLIRVRESVHACPSVHQSSRVSTIILMDVCTAHGASFTYTRERQLTFVSMPVCIYACICDLVQAPQTAGCMFSDKVCSWSTHGGCVPFSPCPSLTETLNLKTLISKSAMEQNATLSEI